MTEIDVLAFTEIKKKETGIMQVTVIAVYLPNECGKTMSKEMI